MNIKPLATKLSQKGFQLQQIVRNGPFAIFNRFQKFPEKGHFEVVVIQSHNGRKIGETYLEPAEFYPSDSQWGQYGWTFTPGMSGSREQAFLDATKKFDELIAADEEKKNQLKK